MVVFSPQLLFSQDSDSTTVVEKKSDEYKPPPPKRYYYLSPRVSVMSPSAIGNVAFKRSFVGVYEASAGLNMYLYKGFFLGIGYKYGMFKIMDNKISNYNATMQLNNIAFKLGTDAYMGEDHKFIFSASVSGGYNWTNFYGLICKTENKPPDVTSYQCLFMEPELNIYYLVEPNFAFGITASYSVYNHNFNPYELCLNEWKSYDKNNTGNTQIFSFGFGFYYSLIQKKSSKK